MHPYAWLRRALRHPTWRRLLLVTLVLVGLPGCNAFAPQTPLPFQTLAQAEFLSGTDGKTRLTVAATAQEGDAFAVKLRKASAPPAALERLYQIDYRSSFALLVVRQSVGSGGFQITVQEITRQGNQVSIRVSFGSPNPNEVQIQSFTAPYHLVTVSKSGTWGQPIHFVVLADNQVIAETTHIIP
jgi:hypothetical protein